MNTTECKFEGCEKDKFAKGFCSGHYRQSHAGETLRPLRGRMPKKNVPQGCEAPGCKEEKHYARGLCRLHYGRLKQTGQLTARTHEKAVCSEEGCDLTCVGKNLCRKHYANWYYYNREIKPVNENHHAYKPDTQNLNTIHARLRFARGHARNYFCTDCPEQAQDWSLKHDAAGKQQVTKGTKRDMGAYFSHDVMDYEPRCDRCHRAYDASTGNRKYYTGEHAQFKADAV